MEVTRIASMGGSSKGNIRVGTLCSFPLEEYSILLKFCSVTGVPFLLLMGDVCVSVSVCVWFLYLLVFGYTLLAPWLSMEHHSM